MPDTTPVRTRFIKASLSIYRMACGFSFSVAAIMPEAMRSGKPRQRRKNRVFPLSGMRGLCEHGDMAGPAIIVEFRRTHRASFVLCALLAAIGPARAEGCSFEPQGEGRVAAVIDARTFRLQDGREVRLAGIEPVANEKTNQSPALAAVVAGHDVTLRGEDDTPDRYGRQPAFVFLDSSDRLVQGDCWRRARRWCRLP
jgi:hypothetical protein